MNSARIILLMAMSALLFSCGDDGPTTPAPGPAQNNLVFTRDDQSQISFPSDAELFVWCGPWQEGEVDTASLQVFFGASPNRSAGDLQAVLSDVTVGEPLPFPNFFIWDQPKDVDIFVADAPNELSTSQDDSSGSIVFQKLDCGSGGEVEFSIDAVIDSEFGDGPSMHVTGTFRAPIGQRRRASALMAKLTTLARA